MISRAMSHCKYPSRILVKSASPIAIPVASSARDCPSLEGALCGRRGRRPGRWGAGGPRCHLPAEPSAPLAAHEARVCASRAAFMHVEQRVSTLFLERVFRSDSLSLKILANKHVTSDATAAE